ncbi:MAG: rod-binding protein [Gemmatimonadaceae bacterium]|nr:rod-binding protein [Gemmatimonadaceae bacterium]
MTAPIGRPTGPVPAAPERAQAEAALKKSAQALEGLFVNQLFAAMRASVPTDGLVEKGPGEELFASMLDQQVADQVAQRAAGPHDLTTSLFDALRHRLGPSADTAR